MSGETRAVNRGARDGEIVATLAELEALESSLGAEVDRLSDVQAPPPGREEPSVFRDRPLWWWRYRLIMWAHSRPVRATYAADILRGLRIVLKEWDDSTLFDFLSQLPAPTPAAPARRRRTA